MVMAAMVVAVALSAVAGIVTGLETIGLAGDIFVRFVFCSLRGILARRCMGHLV
jgi:hypothetical protein